LTDKFIVLYAGAHGPANDLPTILRAARRLTSTQLIHFIFAGDGKDRSLLEAMAHDLALTNVTFLGAVPKENIPMVVSSANVCVATLMDIPMFATTYTNKVFDYMAAGKPTILAIDGVIRKVIENAKGGVFVPPSDDFALAEAINKL